MSGDKVIDSVLMARILFALRVGEDNALEAYNTHINKCGDHRKSRRDEFIADHLKSDLNEVKYLIKILHSMR